MGRAPCCSKDAGLNRGAWTAEEDSILTQYISIHGDGGWKYLPPKAGLKRCGKSCRLRWLNYLRPDIKRGNISADEEELIIRMHKLLGNRWSLIAGRLPGRTDNEIKNYWNTKLVKKLEIRESAEEAKETSTTSKSPSANSEDQRIFRTVAVRTTAVRIANDPYKEVANCTSKQHQEIKLQKEGSQNVDGSEPWSQSFVDDLIAGSDFDLVEYTSAQNTMESESSSMEFIGQRCSTSLPINAISEVNTCKSASYLREMSSPEDNLPCSQYDFSKPIGGKEQICSLQTSTHQIDSVETFKEQGIIEMFDDIGTDDWINELQHFRMTSLFQEEENWVERNGYPDCMQFS
ncbi:hypothetical protein SUGI_1002700 [Cryptomeria japonica]|uniref:transcription factor MYB1 n=1 Tax=Cryptomeria japonica TaxID=3369 RepID=UPI002414C5D1|nr:transcription factor MYB1 [Cryptomeria japonica]GLJ47496.1 hypothetical protein SUGI_1002700 [Cryptomeria japonica]